MNRRNFLSSAGVLLAGHSFNGLALKSLATSAAPTKADYALRIEPCTLDIGPGVSTKTIGYNGQVQVRCFVCAKVFCLHRGNQCLSARRYCTGMDWLSTR
jgi:hypothetical protein